jgi:hypothetical protein
MPKWLEVLAALIILGLAVEYWYITLPLLAFGGWAWHHNERRKAREAKHAVCLARIAALEAELGIG